MERVLFHLLDGGAADAARRRIDDSQQADGVVGADHDFEVRKNVLYLGALIETEPADDDVLAAVTAQSLLDLARLRVGAIQDRHALQRIARQTILNGIGDPHPPLLLIWRFFKGDFFSYPHSANEALWIDANT